MALIVVPTYVRSDDDMAITHRCLESIVATSHADANVLVVDDGSPDPTAIEWICDNVSVDRVIKDSNEGFAKTVNVGIRRAMDTGQDVILVNADVELLHPGWVGEFYTTVAGYEVPIHPVQGAVLLFPGDPSLVQHAGVYFSVLRREFDHIHRYAPAELPDLAEWRRCPVTGALMFISRKQLGATGLFDESFRMGWEDLDYCLRVFQGGHDCFVNPNVRAIHHEGIFRDVGRSDRVGRRTQASWRRLWEKHAATGFADFVPTMLGV
jgi:GT2 family glycosyltransferase